MAGFSLLLTLLIRPWRNSVSQDDGTYAWQVLSFLKGEFVPHPDNISAVRIQTSLGAAWVGFWQFVFSLLHVDVSPLILLNLLTWVLFIMLMFFCMRHFKWSPVFTVGVFSTPYWIQYGASFLYDIYAVVGICLFLGGGRFIRVVVSFLSALQLQSLAVLPFVMGAFRRRWVWVMTSLASVFVYFVLPRSLFQISLLQGGNGAFSGRSIVSVIATAVQLACGFGFFFIPWIERQSLLEKRALRLKIALILHGALWVLLWKSSLTILAAGLFFSDYLPRVGSAFIATLGVWGLVGSGLLGSLARSKELSVVSIGFWAIYSLKGVNDLRYAMIAVPLGWWALKNRAAIHMRIGDSWIFSSVAMTLSIFLNLYNLDTVGARWDAARMLEARGVKAQEISAGYGRDVFTLEADCTRLAHEKGQNWRPFVPRVYQVEWTPRYVVKPYEFFGRRVGLPVNQMNGQGGSNFEVIPYRSFGFSHALAVYQNGQFVPARCFR
jgi:hypothetical protein